MDLDSYLNQGFLWVPTFDKTRQKNSLQYSVKKKFGDYFNIVNCLNTKYSLVCCTVVVLYGSSKCLQDLDFDREQLKVVQGKMKKTATFPYQNI
jgi:hypothetical protein